MQVEERFNQGIELLISNQRDRFEDFLAQLPYKSGLESLLRLSSTLVSCGQVNVSTEVRERIRLKVMREARRRASQRLSTVPVRKPAFAWRKLVVVAVILTLLGSSTVAMARESLPGSALYSVKLAVEKGQLLLTFNKEANLKLRLRLAEERLREIKKLQERGEYKFMGISINLLNETIDEVEADEQAQMLADELEEVKAKREVVLLAVLEKVPDKAKQAIINALGRGKRKGFYKKKKKFRREENQRSPGAKPGRQKSQESSEQNKSLSPTFVEPSSGSGYENKEDLKGTSGSSQGSSLSSGVKTNQSNQGKKGAAQGKGGNKVSSQKSSANPVTSQSK